MFIGEIQNQLPSNPKPHFQIQIPKSHECHSHKSGSGSMSTLLASTGAVIIVLHSDVIPASEREIMEQSIQDMIQALDVATVQSARPAFCPSHICHLQRPRIEIDHDFLSFGLELHGPTGLAPVAGVSSSRTIRRRALNYDLVEPATPDPTRSHTTMVSMPPFWRSSSKMFSSTAYHAGSAEIMVLRMFAEWMEERYGVDDGAYIWGRHLRSNRRIRMAPNIHIERLIVLAERNVLRHRLKLKSSLVRCDPRLWPQMEQLLPQFGVQLRPPTRPRGSHLASSPPLLAPINQDAGDWARTWNEHKIRLDTERTRSPRDLFFFGMIENGLRGFDSAPELADDDDIDDVDAYGIDWEDLHNADIMAHHTEHNATRSTILTT
ncbi:hypothetical protein B0H14DRAFT_2601052 [Mycena olivaceomarginata]|nr:hypothetical protein B0H14DRAFT_2601052 [Mycena olivaceomarginata]